METTAIEGATSLLDYGVLGLFLLLCLGALVYVVRYLKDIVTIITFVTATVVTGVGLWGFVREFISKGVSFSYNSNVITYIVAFASGFLPILTEFDIVPAIDGFIGAVASGDFGQIFAALFVIGNIVWKIVQAGRKEKEDVASPKKLATA